MFITLKANAKSKSTTFFHLCILCGFVGAGHLYAENVHKSVLVQVQGLEKSSPNSEKKQAISAQKLSYYRSSLDEELISKIDQTISYLENLAKTSALHSKSRLKFLAKILNLNFEQAIYVATQESYQYEKLWQDWDSAGRKGAAPQLNETVSKSHWKKVSEQAAAILQEFPKSAEADNISYDRAIAQQYLGLREQSVQTLLKLIQDYPTSPIFYDAHFAVGEYYFDKANFPLALSHFIKSSQDSNDIRQGWSLFKIAWCYFNLADYPKAVQYWQKAIAHADAKIRDDKKSGILKDASFRDLMWAYIELQDTAGAIAYYRSRKGDEYIAPFLKRLANAYTSKGLRKDAYQTWAILLKESPFAGEAFEAQTEIIAWDYDTKQYNLLWSELEKLFKTYASNSVWAKRNQNHVVEVATKKTPVLMVYYAKVTHKQAQQSNDATLYAEALKGYKLYLKLYAQPDDYVEVLEYMADILYLQKNYEAAGRLYANIVKMGKDKAMVSDAQRKNKVSIHDRSGKNMLDSYSKDFLPEFQIILKMTPDFKKQAKPLSAKAKNFIESCNLYVQTYASDKVAAKNCDLQISEIYFRTGQIEQSKSQFYVLMNKYSGEKEGMAAAENLVVMTKDNKVELKKLATSILGMPVYAQSPLGTKLRELLRGMDLEVIAKESSKGKRAELYEDRAKKYPNDPEADKFLYNAANDFLDAGEIVRARNAFAELVVRYPKSTLAAGTLLTLGKLFDKTRSPKEASKYLLLFAQKSPADKSAPAAALRACELMILDDYVRAWDQCRLIVSQNPKDAVAFIERLVQIAWSKKNYSWMISLIQQNYLALPLSANQKILALDRVRRVGSSQQKTQASQQMRQLAKQKGVSGEALRNSAEVLFQDVEERYTKQMALRLQGGSVDNLQGSIQKISEGLAALEQAYSTALATQDAYWGIAVFYKLATAYEAFGKMMQDPPSIEGIASADIKAHLKESVDQVMAKAKEYYETGLGVAKKFHVFNAWVPLLRQADVRWKAGNVIAPPWVLQPDLVGGIATEQSSKLLE